MPLIVTEGGVGRGLQPISDIIDAKGDGEAGTNATTYAPAATYITNKNRAFAFDQNHIGIADFSQTDVASMLYWHADHISGQVMWGTEPL